MDEDSLPSTSSSLWSYMAASWWPFLTAVVLLYSIYWILERRWQFTLFERLGVPFVKPHFLYGSYHTLRDGQSVATEVMDGWMKQYGKVFGYFFGRRPMMVIADLDILKHILIKDFHNFTNRPKLVLKAQPVVDTLVGLRSQRWKDVRSVLSPTFSMVKMKHMAAAINEKIDTLIDILEDHVSRRTPVEFYSTFQGLTLDVISECALAMKTNCQHDQNNDPFFTAVRSFLKNAINPAVAFCIYFPGLSSILSFISNRLALSGRMTRMIISNLEKVIALRRNNVHEKRVDVIQLMLEAAESSSVDPTSKHSGDIGSQGIKKDKKLLTDAEIIANAWVFLLAGFETTANALTYTTYLLARHPDVQEKLFREVNSFTEDGNSLITYDQISKMVYLEQVLNESLRIFPPIVTFVTREAAEDTIIQGIKIPKGTPVMAPIWQIHRDPEQWPDPEKFDPERFSQEEKLSFNRHPMAYLPFGAGPRNCIGMRFAQLEAKIAIAKLIKKFRLEVCDRTPVSLRFTIPTVAINPATGVFLTVVPRK